MESRIPLVTTFRVDSTCPEEFTEVMAPLTGGAEISATQRRGFRASVRAVRMPRVGIFTAELSVARVSTAQLNVDSLTIAQCGTFRAGVPCRFETYGSHTAHAAKMGSEFTLLVPTFGRQLVANFEPSLLAAHVAALRGGESAAPEPRSAIDLRTPEAGSLLAYLRFLFREVSQPGTALRTSGIVHEAEDLLAALFVHALDTKLGRRELSVPPVRSVRWAEEFLVAHLEDPVSLAQLARASGQSVRSISRAFKNKHGFGPMTFLRHQRLEAAQRDLRRAERGSTTVSQVALRYGFNNLGRFAHAYRELFGESPSATLRN